MGFIDLVKIIKPAHPSNSRVRSAYQVHECGVSRIRLACHHQPSATWLRGFEDLAQLHQAAWLWQRATAPRSAPRPVLIPCKMDDVDAVRRFGESADSTQQARSAQISLGRSGSSFAAGPEALPFHVGRTWICSQSQEHTLSPFQPQTASALQCEEESIELVV